MIIFFYGEDDYRLKQAVKKLKEKFISASLGDTNLSILDGKTAEYSDINRQILAMPFLSRTRLVIIENLISSGKKSAQGGSASGRDIHEKVINFLKKVPSSTILVFTETKPDKRTALFKKLIKADKVQEFVPLEEPKLRSWIKKEIEVRGGEIEPEAMSKLIEYVGSDLWRMRNEIDKLTAYKAVIATPSMSRGKQSIQGGFAASTRQGGSPRNDIKVEDIELLVKSQVESDIFKMIDAIGQKNLKTALKECQNLLENGENELYILSMIVYQYRNLLIIKDLIERNQNLNSWALAKKAGLHPYVVQKTLAQTKNFTMENLKKSYRTLLDFDYRIKTGKIESRTALSLLLVKLTAESPITKIQ